MLGPPDSEPSLSKGRDSGAEADSEPSECEKDEALGKTAANIEFDSLANEFGEDEVPEVETSQGSQFAFHRDRHHTESGMFASLPPAPNSPLSLCHTPTPTDSGDEDASL
eukprot:3309661-Alexandrium_andersonii.AAC.1